MANAAQIPSFVTSEESTESVKKLPFAQSAALNAFILIFFLWLLFGLYVTTIWAKTDSDTLPGYGQFGDSFGALNALFTGLALAGLVYTALLQHEQTSLLQEQLTEQRKEASRQAREQFLTVRLNAQVAALQAQVAHCSMLPSADARQAAIRDLGMAQIYIEILGFEAPLGFDGGHGHHRLRKNLYAHIL